ncbi:MAG: preprotein translocase subunit YajC [Phycisphaerales bacterium]
MFRARLSSKLFPALFALAALATDALATGAPPLTGGPIPTGGGGGADGGAAQGPPAGGFSQMFLFLMLGMLALMIFTSVSSGRKEKRKMQDMMSSLSRHDKVMTNGGIIGVITELRDDEVVLKVDESTNTRIRFTKAAIKTVLKSAAHKDEAALSDSIESNDSIEELKPVESSAVS